MDIAVIIPLYNGEKWIGETIESVLKQSHAPTEIIIVDNNSTDSSVQIIKNFPQIQLIKNSIPGVNLTRQLGFQASKSDFVTFLDQDDIWHEDHLKYLSSFLCQYPDYPAAIASSLSFSSSKNIRFPNTLLETFDYNPWTIFPTNQVTTPSNVLIRRTALESIGGWPSHINFCADVYTWLRLSVNHPLLQNKGVTVAYRKHNKSQTNELLAINTQKYFNSLFNGLEEALTYNLVVNEQKRYELKKRLSALSAMYNIIVNTLDYNSSQLNKSIIFFEESLFDEKDEIVSSMCGLLIWFLSGNLLNQPFLLSHLLQSFPESAPRSRKFFRSRIASSRILAKRLLFEPFNYQLWLLLLQFFPKIIKKLNLYRF